MNKNIFIGLAVLIVFMVGYGLLNTSKSETTESNVQNANTSTEVASNKESTDSIDIMTVDEQGMTTVDTTALTHVLENTDEYSVVNSDEQAGALFMLEEEKLAHDVYRTLYDVWGARVFDTISQSEKTHIEAVRSLAEAYELPIGFYDETVGVFHDEKLAELYTELTERGSESLEEAFRVGILIEELDIVDLQRYIDATDNNDFIVVYENLQKGSRNHLRAFVKNLSGVYEPEFLTQVEYDEIISEGTERGQGGHR